MQDIEFFPDGDNTEIGERGVNLSGGQQQRVNFARMMYQDGDIAILDDPLSAVDAHVGKHLFEEAIKKGLHGKTRILVTHQINYLNQCDYIIVLKNGRIAEQGEYTELLSNNGELSFLMRDLKTLESSSNTNEKFENADLNIQAVRKLAENNASAADGIIRKEERETGNVSFKVWRTYVMANGGLLYFVSLCLTLLLSLGSRTMTDIWLSFWANESISSFTRDQYIGVYFGLGLSQAVFYHIVGYVYAHGGVRASQNIYKRAINNIIHAPISFFDSNPIGRILNRFSKDQDAIDFGMLDSFRMFTYTAGICTFVFAVAIVGTPIFSATLIPIMGIYYYVQRYYRHTSVELKRIDSISRSPLYSHISESIKGINTIRAYKKESQFIGRLESLMDQSNSPFYLVESASHWLGVRLETISAVLIFFCAFFGILYRFQLTPSLYGLVLSFIMQVTGMLSWSILQFTLTESAMNAVERLDYYGKVEQEAPYEIANTKPPQEWPRTGTIVFENVGLRYKSDGPLVLKGISFKISEKEKIGVVGRTGSGKSSLILALFRMVEPCSGKIMIDGIDVSTIGLLDLRSKIGIIPQFPVLLQGSIRRNLDPFDLFSDEMLWEALEKSSMKIKTIEMGGLDALISQSGDNLSVGQRQLICLARALLAQNKILIMDEATANVDFETDKAIQDCVNTQFSSTTVITIAHRLVI
jgi:ABC-type multidrug transport system fused ATPase/permease subunit